MFKIFSGLLSCYSWHPELIKRGGNLSFALFAIARFLRTTPVIIATILMVLAFPASWGSGPNFAEVLHNVTTTCVNHAWKEMLYVSNSYDVTSVVSSRFDVVSSTASFASFQCLPHGWYISADFQLYLASFAVLTLLYKKPRAGVFVLFALIAFGFALQFAVPVLFNTVPMWRMDTLDFYKVRSSCSLSSSFVGSHTGHSRDSPVALWHRNVRELVLHGVVPWLHDRKSNRDIKSCRHLMYESDIHVRHCGVNGDLAYLRQRVS